MKKEQIAMRIASRGPKVLCIPGLSMVLVQLFGVGVLEQVMCVMTTTYNLQLMV